MGDRTIRNWCGQLKVQPIRPLLGQRTRCLFAAFALTVSAIFPAPILAWGQLGHETTAQIAMANVTPETRASIARLMTYEAQLGTPDCRIRNLAEASTWPDCLRRDRWRWAYTFAWHYRTAPICKPYDAMRNCSGGNCVLAQIERNHRLLADENLPPNVRLKALGFLAHFVGDVHMPLHSGDNGDRGGNRAAASYGMIEGLNLHQIWDTVLAEQAIASARPPLVRLYSAAERMELAGGAPAEWGRESWQMARDFVYPKAFDQDVCAGELANNAALSHDDIAAAIPLVQRRITQAGLRMATLLDRAFAPGALKPPEPRR